MKKIKKELTIKDFVPCIPWNQLKEIMDKKMYEEFLKWLHGQACLPEGVYPWDLERYLKNLPKERSI